MSNALPAPDPSMDEILASIKRIIESGDEKVIKRMPLTSAAGARSESAAPSIPAGYAEALQSEDGESDDEGAQEDAAGALWASEDRSASLTDGDEFSARFADVGDDLPEAEGQAETGYAGTDRSRFDEDAFETELVGLIGNGDRRADGVSVAAKQADMDEPSRFAAANSDDAGLSRSHHVSLDEPPIVAARALADPAATHRILSQEAGARVAASFEDLARAIREDQMRSVEDAVQEMLRPMLQEWLDDNLPRLVERLVREEIERVATGGRR